ncbi:MAG: TlpA disulfide reductase family protein [Bryobacteraceae bacterium]
MLQAGQSAPTLEPIAELVAKGPVLLAFYKVSCPTCQLAFPFLDRISQGSLQVVGVSQDSPELTQVFNERFGVHFKTVLDPASAGYVLSNAFGITHVPSLFVIEADGRISHSGSGFDKAGLEALGARAGTEVFRDEKVPASKPG